MRRFDRIAQTESLCKLQGSWQEVSQMHVFGALSSVIGVNHLKLSRRCSPLTKSPDSLSTHRLHSIVPLWDILFGF